MSDEEFLQACVDAGIYTPDGQLTPPYRDDAPSVDPRGAQVPALQRAAHLAAAGAAAGPSIAGAATSRRNTGKRFMRSSNEGWRR